MAIAYKRWSLINMWFQLHLNLGWLILEESCILSDLIITAVIKRRGLTISPGYYEHGPGLLSWDNTRKIEPNEILAV